MVGVHASQGRQALRVDAGYASIDQPQDWLGYDFLKADLYTEARKPLDLYVEIRDEANARLLDPGQLLDCRTAWQEHADHPDQAALRGREIAARPDARPGQDHPTGLWHRRCTGGTLYLDNLRLERDDSPVSACVSRGFMRSTSARTPAP